MSLTKKRKMTPTQSQNMAKQESKQKYFSTNPRDKMENYMDYSSESYSNKQGLENVKQYVPPSDKHRISNHNLIPQSSPDEKKKYHISQKQPHVKPLKPQQFKEVPPAIPAS